MRALLITLALATLGTGCIGGESSALVRSRSNFWSPASIEMKNLSSDAASNRSDSKIGWWCIGSLMR